MTWSGRFVPIAALALVCTASVAAAQDDAAKVTGRVTDPSCTFLGFKVKVPVDKIGG